MGLNQRFELQKLKTNKWIFLFKKHKGSKVNNNIIYNNSITTECSRKLINNYYQNHGNNIIFSLPQLCSSTMSFKHCTGCPRT